MGCKQRQIPRRVGDALRRGGCLPETGKLEHAARQVGGGGQQISTGRPFVHQLYAVLYHENDPDDYVHRITDV